MNLYDECERHAAIIRKMTIVTLIMEYIRKLKDQDKLDLKIFCDAVVKAEHNNNKLIYDKVFQKYNLSNQSRVESVTNLKIKHKDHEKWLNKWYYKTKNVYEEDDDYKALMSEKINQEDRLDSIKGDFEGEFFNILRFKLEKAIKCGEQMREGN
jgi:hypothetical protein